MIVSMITYWGQITIGSVVWVAKPSGLYEGTIVDMRSATRWGGPVHPFVFNEPVVDLNTGTNGRLVGVPLSELHPDQWTAQNAYVQALVQRTVREELAKTKEIEE